MQTSGQSRLPVLTEAIAALGRSIAGGDRLLVCGAPGAGKTTFTRLLARELETRGLVAFGIDADPGSPSFGVPGALALGAFRESSWQRIAIEPLCSLDAGRFRLPLVRAASRLAQRARSGPLLVDAPGMVRGVAGSELLPALAEATGATAIAALVATGRNAPFVDEIASLSLPVHIVHAHPGAHPTTDVERTRRRTSEWRAFLAASHRAELRATTVKRLGTPPPLDAPDAWRGRQAALFRAGELLAMGEVESLRDDAMHLVLDRPLRDVPDTLLMRDAVHRDGALTTAPSRAAAAMSANHDPVPSSSVEPITVEAGPIAATLVNGVFGDALVHVRVRGERSTILLDLGDSAGLTRREIHRVSHVFLSHAHLDHIAGFMWLLRARIGSELPACHVYGPPGIRERIANLVGGVVWDRIGDAGPEFLVGELEVERLTWTRVKAGLTPEPLGEVAVAQGRLLETPRLAVSATALDHRIPVLSYALETRAVPHVRSDRLEALGVAPGKWLGELRHRAQRGDCEGNVQLPDGRMASVADLADQLLEVRPGTKLVYATDLADTSSNRARLAAHARDADVLFCESTFRANDAEQARRTQHLTTRACGEIAAAARVARLVPFHFSKRYEGIPHEVYREIGAAATGVRVVGPN